MALTVQPLAGFPAVNSALLSPTNGTPTDAITNAYSPSTAQNISFYVEDTTQCSTYVPTPGTVWVAGILDAPGVQPGRVFPCDNGSGTTPQKVLPTLVQVILVYETGGSIQEFGQTTSNTAPGNFVVVLSPATGGLDSGVYPFGYTVGSGAGANPVAITLQGGAYTASTANTTSTLAPQPQQVFKLSLNAMLITASSSTG